MVPTTSLPTGPGRSPSSPLSHWREEVFRTRQSDERGLPSHHPPHVAREPEGRAKVECWLRRSGSWGREQLEEPRISEEAVEDPPLEAVQHPLAVAEDPLVPVEDPLVAVDD